MMDRGLQSCHSQTATMNHIHECITHESLSLLSTPWPRQPDERRFSFFAMRGDFIQCMLLESTTRPLYSASATPLAGSLGMALCFSCGGSLSFFLFMSYLYIFGTPFSMVKPRHQTVFDYAQGRLFRKSIHSSMAYCNPRRMIFSVESWGGIQGPSVRPTEGDRSRVVTSVHSRLYLLVQ